MAFARFQAAMHRTEPNGVNRRASLEASAAAGNAVAIAELVAPPFPETVAYLWTWVLEIRQGLGAGMDGLASLTWTALDAWCRLTGRKPHGAQITALFALDRALKPDAPQTPAVVAAETSPPARIAPWPSRQPGGV